MTKSCRSCASHFRPEFLNRSTRSSCSTGCGARTWAAIVDIQFRRLGRLLEDRKITLQLDARAEWLAEKGYDPAYGARPLKRVIQKNVQDPLAEAVLAGEIGEGRAIVVSAASGVLTLDGKPVGRPDAANDFGRGRRRALTERQAELRPVDTSGAGRAAGLF